MTGRIPEHETLTVEFKSDRKRLPDRDLILAAVCLANTEGGKIYVGVEDDGTVTGLHRAHQSTTGLAALIANRTSPPLSVRCCLLEVEGKKVARIGLAERTGRGVDLIYRGLLGYGRPAPSYARSTADTVVLDMSCGDADLGFVEMVLNEEKRRGVRLPIDTLLVLDLFRRERRVDTPNVARILQKDVPAARAVLELLVEAGLVTAHGVKKGRTYTLSPRVYRGMGKSAGFVRQAGFDPIQQEEMVKRYVREHGVIRRQDVMNLCHQSGPQASRLLKKLVGRGLLRKTGERRWTRYEPGPLL